MNKKLIIKTITNTALIIGATLGIIYIVRKSKNAKKKN